MPSSRRRRAIRIRLAIRDGRMEVVVRLEPDERLVSGLVTAAALLGASILYASGAPPRLAGLSVSGLVLLACALFLLARLSGPDMLRS